MTTSKISAINVTQLLRIALAVAVSAVAALALIGATSWAQDNGDTGTANTLKISPIRSDVTADPGETKVVKVTVTNPTDQKVSVRVIQNDFVAGDEDGTPAIILEETEYAESHSLKRFMTPVENITLEANASRTIDVQLAVPANAEPGGYFGVVRFAPTDPDSGGQVNVSASVASLILLTVNGDAPEKLNLTSFVVEQNKQSKLFFTSGQGLAASARFVNEGKVQAGPFGKVSVLRGSDVVYEVDFNDKAQRDMVLPSSARRWSIPIENVSAMGKYTVSATFTYGTQNQTIEVAETFWVIPKTVIIAVAIATLGIVAAIAGFVWRRRRNRGHMGLSGSARRR